MHSEFSFRIIRDDVGYVPDCSTKERPRLSPEEITERRRVIAAYMDEGKTPREISVILGLSYATTTKFIRDYGVGLKVAKGHSRPVNEDTNARYHNMKKDVRCKGCQKFNCRFCWYYGMYFS